MTTGEPWLRVKELFHSALERAPEDRLAFLAEAAAGDEAVYAEVLRLLSALDAAGSFMDTSPLAGVAHEAFGAPTLTGRVLGHYRVERRIGAGGMGEVYAAHDTELGRVVALKVVTTGTPESQAALRREAQHASQLNHPHICTVHDVGTVDGLAYIVMEFVEGRTLREVLEGGALPVESVLRYGVQISDALEHAHAHRVIHRDLKSANVVVTPDARAKILDFGLARALSPERVRELTESRSTVPDHEPLEGTLAYMAPELLKGARADARSDVWALGVVLYEMAAGRRPFEGDTVFETTAAILAEPPTPLPSRIPESLQAIIRRTLAKGPDERYGHAGELRAALEAARAHADGRPETGAHGWVRGRLSRPPVVAALVLIAAVGTAIPLLRPDSPPDAPRLAIGVSGRPAIAVLAFKNVSGAQETAWLSTGVPTMLLTGLAQTPGLEIVGAERLRETLEQIGLSDQSSLDHAAAADAARRAGAGAIVVGSILRLGSQIRIDAQMEDLAGGRVLFAETVRGTDLFALVDQLTLRIREGIGLGEAPGIRRIAEVSTASLEAYRLYSEGHDARINTRWDDARRSLELAVAVDPEFAEAYLEQAIVSSADGRPLDRREYLRKAAVYADRLNERRRLFLAAQLARDDGNAAEAGRRLDELIAKFPDDAGAYVMAFNLYAPVTGPLQDIEKLMSTAQAGAAALPTSPATLTIYGYSLFFAGRYADAARQFEAYARIAPREPNPFDSLGDAYLRMGMAGTAIESYSRALAIDPAFSHNGRAWALAVLGRYDEAIRDDASIPSVNAVILSRVGRYQEAGQVVARGVQRAESAGDVADAGGLHLVAALLAIERDEQASALREIAAAKESLMTAAPHLRRIYLLLSDLLNGIAELRGENVERALGRLASLERSYNPSVGLEKWWHSALQGEIALARGDLTRAERAFSEGEPPVNEFKLNTAATGALMHISRDGLARVARARGNLADAIRIYRRLLTHGPEQNRVAAFEPRYVLEIARLLEKSGQADAAGEEYRRFLQFWSGADRNQPEIAEAQRALGASHALPAR